MIFGLVCVETWFMKWYDTWFHVRYGMICFWHTVCYLIWFVLKYHVWYNMIWFGMIWNLIWHDMIWSGFWDVIFHLIWYMAHGTGNIVHDTWYRVSCLQIRRPRDRVLLVSGSQLARLKVLLQLPDRASSILWSSIIISRWTSKVPHWLQPTRLLLRSPFHNFQKKGPIFNVLGIARQAKGIVRRLEKWQRMARKPFLDAVRKGGLQHDHITIRVLLYAKFSCSLLLVNVHRFLDQVHTRLY